MKMPDNKKEKIQMLVLLAISGIAVLYFAFQFGLRPILKSKKDRTEKIATLETQIKDAKMLLEQTAGDSAEIRQALLTVKAYSDKHLLHPRLNDNYNLGAMEALEQWLKQADLKAISMNPVATTPVPVQQADPAQRVLSTYGMQVNLQCDTQQFIGLLRIIEEANPFICITAVSITAQPADSTKHVVQFTVEFLTWTDRKMPVILEDQIKASMTRQG